MLVYKYSTDKEYLIVFDIAKKHDYSALAIYRIRPDIKQIGTLNPELKVIEKLEWVKCAKFQDKPYTEQIQLVKQITESPSIKNNYVLIIDATGVGEPIKDMMRDEGLDPFPIVFTGGVNVTTSFRESDTRFGSDMLKRIDEYMVPKQDMIHATQIMLQQQRVAIAPNCGHNQEIKQQLTGFVGRINEKGHLSAEAMTDDIHDDLVCVLIMACWYVQQKLNSRIEKPLKQYSNSQSTKRYSPLSFISREV